MGGLNITCCNKDLHGKPPGRDDAFTATQEWMPKTFWLYYCCCTGFGLSGCSPLIHRDSKLCCFETQVTSGGECMGEGGFYNKRAKLCCLVGSEQCPPTMNIGMACCGKRCAGGEEE